MKVLFGLLFYLSMCPVHASILINGALGVSSPDLPETSLRASKSVDAAYIFSNYIGVGGYYFSSQKNEGFGRFNYSLRGIEVFYWGDEFIKGSAAGLRTGLAEVTWQPSGDILDFTPFAWGIYFQQTWFVAKWFKCGYELGFYSVNGDSITLGSQDFELVNFTSYNLMVLLTLFI